MKQRTEIFLRAAELIDEGSQIFSCNAIDKAANELRGHDFFKPSHERYFYEEHVTGTDPIIGWWPFMVISNKLLYTPPHIQAERVLALCFAAAVSETEE